MNQLVSIWIDDEVWEVFKRSWALCDVRTHEKLVRMLEVELWENSISVLEDAEVNLVGETPEAYALREIGREKERRQGIKPIDENDEKSIGDNLRKLISDHPELFPEWKLKPKPTREAGQ